jgi:hypothetical protein
MGSLSIRVYNKWVQYYKCDVFKSVSIRHKHLYFIGTRVIFYAEIFVLLTFYSIGVFLREESPFSPLKTKISNILQIIVSCQSVSNLIIC